ncbi:type II toxin-antitoxin system ParD family antitoxin [Brevundimonas sp. SL130]|uniref:type II toxin-antitoxin system ParD family antitoxin n=1 Tax=Brevundimonas sp. SL130 TaxID=2995143 RepID=UPI00226C9D41|nr:type II toxin-antitoxin system ParD family antitoxin [Brevundimonas sp. SL130]WAC59121.1 type II toxin-antitoxin system ParD family antitoxin [Brevundimonas sp. SL130]
MSTVSIQLDERMEAFVDEKVRSGAFRDRSEVLIKALGDMKQSDAQLTALKAKIQQGLDELDAGFGIQVDDVEQWLNGLGR